MAISKQPLVLAAAQVALVMSELRSATQYSEHISAKQCAADEIEGMVSLAVVSERLRRNDGTHEAIME
jgi:hypothetical protein